MDPLEPAPSTPEAEFSRDLPLPPFRVVWEPPEAGWIDATIQGETEITLSAGVYDPFPKMVAWVKRCCKTCEVQVFNWNNESSDFVFTFHPSYDFLTIQCADYRAPPMERWEDKWFRDDSEIFWRLKDWKTANPVRRREILDDMLDMSWGSYHEGTPPSSYRDPELDAWK